MIYPRRGEMISVLPYGQAQVVRMLDEGKCQVTLNRMVKTPEGGITNQAVVELHPVWIVREVVNG